MNDEEQKAIKILKINPEIIADLDEEMFEKMCEFKEKSIKELKYWASQTALNLIEKQSKEIEELTGNQCIYKDTSSCTKSMSLKTYIALNKSDLSKEKSSMNYYNLYKELVDKIKAKIEEVKDGTYDAKIVLQSLLEKE